MLIARMEAKDWASLALTAFDIVVFYSRSGSARGVPISEAGRHHVHEYGRGGGGDVGIRAGADRAGSDFKRDLGILSGAPAAHAQGGSVAGRLGSC